MADILGALFPDRRLAWVVIIGFGIRLAMSPWTSWTYDTYPFYQGVVDTLAGLGPYGHMAYSYPPGFVFIALPFAWLLSLFVDPSLWASFQPSLVYVGQVTGMVNPVVTHPAFNLAFKTPLILADYLTGVVLYRFVAMVRDAGTARRVFILWFLNPLVIFISSIYGNFDVLAVLFSVLSLYSMLKAKFFSAGLAIGLGVAFKLFPMYLGLFYFAYLFGLAVAEWRNSTRILPNLRNLGGYVAGGSLGVSSILITIAADPSIMVFLTGRMGTTDMGGVNVWGLMRNVNALLGGGRLPDSAVSGVTVVSNYLLIAILFLILIYVFAMLKGSKESNDRRLLFGSMTVFTILLLFQSITHAHYILWALPFVLLCSIYEGRFELKMALMSIAGVVFWLGLQSYLAFFYPLAAFTGAVPIGTIDRAVVEYYLSPSGLGSEGSRIVPTLMGVAAMVTALLPQSFDPLYRLQERLRRRGRAE
jgi:Gpi18-like mannosyltransferase